MFCSKPTTSSPLKRCRMLLKLSIVRFTVVANIKVRVSWFAFIKFCLIFLFFLVFVASAKILLNKNGLGRFFLKSFSMSSSASII